VDGVCVATVYANGWDNALTQELGVTLLKFFPDSNEGEDAWSTATSPLVFITTLGPGYGGQLGDTTWPGVVVIDANDYSVVTSNNFDMTSEGWTDVFESHGLGVSIDGKWIYLPSGDGRDNGRLLIINARTLKLDKIIGLRGRPHHAKCFKDADGNERVVAYGWEQPPFVMDPADDNRVVGGFSFNESGMEGYLYFVTPDGKEMWASGRWRQGSAIQDVVEGMIFYSVDTATWKLKDYMTFPNETTPIWIDFSPDNKYAFVSGGHSSTVLRYDRTKTAAENKDAPVITPVGEKIYDDPVQSCTQTSDCTTAGRQCYQDKCVTYAGTVGPYGVRSNWEGTAVYAVGKQEGAGNLGMNLGIIDTTRFGEVGYVGEEVITNCLRGDHATLHPVFDKQELWISCNSSFEVVVFDMGNKVVKERIPMPNNASTHSGSFVQYDRAFAGRVLSDQNGLHGTARAEQSSRWTMP
jgi:hypothetical protein